MPDERGKLEIKVQPKKLRSNLLKDTWKGNCNTGGAVITELEGIPWTKNWCFECCGADDPEETTCITSAWWTQSAMWMGHQASENVG